jgi:short-subunit dehydrogenase
MQKLSEVEKLVNEISSREKVLHVLVNNAGAAWGEKFDAYPVRSTLKFSWMMI